MEIENGYKNDLLTAVAVAQLLIFQNNLKHHKNLTSLKAILERFVF